MNKKDLFHNKWFVGEQQAVAKQLRKPNSFLNLVDFTLSHQYYAYATLLQFQSRSFIRISTRYKWKSN